MTALAFKQDTHAIQCWVNGVCREFPSKLNLALLPAIGIRADDLIYCSDPSPALQRLSSLGAIRFTRHVANATVLLFEAAAEGFILNTVAKLSPGKRLIAITNEAEVDHLPLKSFDMVTAVLFDNESRKVIRIFDHQPRPVEDFMHIELADLSGSTISIHAQRIASLR